jgi:hypothetical protein
VLAALRGAPAPVIGRVEEGSVVLDLRTVDAARDIEVAAAAVLALAGTARGNAGRRARRSE